MQFTSIFFLAALTVLKATNVLTLPVDLNAITYNSAREVADFAARYEARSYDDALDFYGREFEEFDHDARDFDDYEYVKARNHPASAADHVHHHHHQHPNVNAQMKEQERAQQLKQPQLQMLGSEIGRGAANIKAAGRSH